ncbi:MAG: DUF1573 domain-containing protein, partial [candidate division Zixibacteria bacterium]|nr:DUF1573 domain-containing protein [candidate division Zixibacteria bacterium]
MISMRHRVSAMIVLGTVVMLLFALREDTHADLKLSLHHPTYDFGYVPQRSHVSHRFWVHNDGDEPLTIDRIDVGCWCTSTSRLDDPIAPGDSAAILVTLNTTIIQGHVRKWIKLFTSIVTGDHERLWIRG